MTDSRSASEGLTGLDAAARRRVRIGGLIAAVVAGLLILAAGPAVRQPLYDLFQKFTPTAGPSSRVHVVLIDADSLAAVGAWPWSRYALARLTEEIADRGAAAIGFDLLFSEPDRQTPELFAKLYPELSAASVAEVSKLPSMDAVFARVIGRYPVVLARAGVTADSFDAVQAADALPSDARFEGTAPSSIPVYEEVTTNIPLLDGAALGRGLVNGPPDDDGVVRRVPLLGRAGGHLTPAFSLELVRISEGEETIRLEDVGGRLGAIRVGKHRVPVNAKGEVVLKFTGLRGVQLTSAVNLIREGVPADAFKGKIVLVGLTSAGTSDVVTTPLETETYGVFIQAQAVDAILRGSGLTRPGWLRAAEWAVGVLLAALAFALVPRLSLGAILAFIWGVIVVTLAASWIGFTRGLLIDPGAVAAPAAASTAVMIALLLVEGGRVQARLRTALERERLGAAKVAGELAAASEIQAGMLLPRAALAKVSKDVEVDAILLPARTVGGDLYDAFQLSDGRLCFLTGDVTGKGVPASLFMALSKALSRSLLMRPGIALADAVAGINAELSRDNGQAMAVSLLVGLLDPKTGRLDLCSAGHEDPLVVSATGAVRELKLDGGPPLCVDETFPYPIERAELGAGETLVALTDGVTEAFDPEGRAFGRKRAIAAVQALAGRPLPELVDGVVAAVRDFEAGGEPSDDLTVLALRRRA